MPFRIVLPSLGCRTATLIEIMLAITVGGMLMFQAGGCQAPGRLSGLASLRDLEIPLGPGGRRRDEDRSLRQSVAEMGGPLRRVAARLTAREKDEPKPLDKSEIAQEFAAAKKLFDDGQYIDAEKAFKRIIQKGRSWKLRFKPDEKLLARVRANPYREDAMFYLAECQFRRQRYAKAQDSYVNLMNQYPSTQYLDRATRRLFQIAKYWLGATEFEEIGEIQQVAAEASDEDAPPPPKKLPAVAALPIVPNVLDRTRPVFDTNGRALQALKSIWLNDPTGPLADDALMLAATYHLRKGHYTEADHLFGILRDEYPKSPHLEKAFLLGSHVKLMAYQGPEYDAKKLLEAEQLKETTLRLFPNLPDREQLKQELARIEEAKAERDWAVVQFYLRKKRLKAVAVYCNLILEEHPKSKYAEKARELLEEISGDIGRVRLEDEPNDSALKRLPKLHAPRLLPVPGSTDDAPKENDQPATIRLSG